MWPRGHTLQATAGMLPSSPTSGRLPGNVTGEAVAKLKKPPRALAPELARASRLCEEYYVISIESEDVNMRIRNSISMTLAITLIATAPAWSQSLLKTLDPDHDGTVDLAEAKNAASKLFDKLDRDHDGTLDKRELQTLSLLAQGKPYGRIAEELNVSYKTVVNACSQLKQKLNAKNLPELIRVAVRLLSAE